MSYIEIKDVSFSYADDARLILKDISLNVEKGEFVLVVLVLRTMQALRVFEIIYQLTQGGPNNSTMVVSFYAYFKTFSSLDFGYGSTIGMLIAVITIIITLVYKKVLEDKEV
ncbi:MAG: hypothetical protein K1W34_01430 [Lachnospiraceae bacterium]